jgi:hypothetical protein
MGFTEDDLKDRISVALTDWMVTRHGGRTTGLEFLRDLQAKDKNYMIRTLPPPVDGAAPIGTITHWMTVKESSTGKYVEHYGIWHGPGLKDLPAGTKVEVVIEVRDVRTPTVYFDGCSRGKIAIEARWRTGGPLTYAALVAAARSKRSGKNKHYPERGAEDVETALEQLERSVAGTPASKRKSPSAGAALVADLRGDGAGADEATPAVGAGAPPGTKAQGTDAPRPATPPPSNASNTVAAFENPPEPRLSDEVLKRIKAKKLIYLGGH